ncbi:MAG: hypothetical protein IJQ16_06735 [Selenomonadaceae bacterium]|nr:hypothetical protein [Selenomonadaceae bacterium]
MLLANIPNDNHKQCSSFFDKQRESFRELRLCMTNSIDLQLIADYGGTML